MQAFTKHTGVVATMDRANVDTDQIIPARFLTTTDRKGLGQFAFFDWRYDSDGAVRADSPLDHLDRDDHRILVAGSNFGCGSSREHAPWALHDFGFRAVISSDIADIFTSNALKTGLLPIIVDEEVHGRLLSEPGMMVMIDLEDQILTVGNRKIGFRIEPFARRCLLDGVDTLGALQMHADAIDAYEKHVQG